MKGGQAKQSVGGQSHIWPPSFFVKNTAPPRRNVGAGLVHFLVKLASGKFIGTPRLSLPRTERSSSTGLGVTLRLTPHQKARIHNSKVMAFGAGLRFALRFIAREYL